MGRKNRLRRPSPYRSNDSFLRRLEVISAEADARKQRYLKTRLQLAHLPYVKTFDQFDLGFQPSIDERQIRELRTLRFVHEASNVIPLGPPGVGNSFGCGAGGNFHSVRTGQLTS